jgi:hypothetical protein
LEQGLELVGVDLTLAEGVGKFVVCDLDIDLLCGGLLGAFCQEYGEADERGEKGDGEEDEDGAFE